MRDIGFNVLNKNNGIIKQEPSVISKESSFDEDHTELYIKRITLSIYHFSCHTGTAASACRYKKTDTVPADFKVKDIGELINVGQVIMHGSVCRLCMYQRM